MKPNKRSFPIFEIALLLLVFFLHISILFASPEIVLHYFSEDEAFYSFQIARNVVEGHGVTFDRVTPTNSIAPVWLLVLTPIFWLARINIVLPLRLMVILSALLNAGAAIFLYRLARRALSEPIAMLAGLTWAVLPRILEINVHSGMESALNAFLLLVFLNLIVQAAEKSCDCLSNRELIKVGLAAAALFLTRYDNFFLIVVFGVWLVFRSSRMRYMVLVDAMIILVSVFGSFMLRFELKEIYLLGRPAQWVMAMALLVKPTLMYFAGMYFPPRTWSRGKMLLYTFLGLTFSSLLIAGLLNLAEMWNWLPGFPRTVLILDWLFSLVLLGGLRFGLRLVARLRGFKPDGIEPALRLKHQWKNWLRVWTVYLTPALLSAAGVLLWNWINFRHLMPLNLLVKRWWTGHVTIHGQPPQIFLDVAGLSAKPGEPWSFILTPVLDRMSRWVTALMRVDNLELYQLLVVLFAGGFAYLGYQLVKSGHKHDFLQVIDRGLALLPLYTSCFLLVGYYKLVGYVEMRPWYWEAPMILTLLGLAFLTQRLVDLAAEKLVPQVVFQICGGVVAASLLIAGISEQVNIFSRKSIPESAIFTLSALEEVTQPGDLIACVEAGKLGYLANDRLIINLDGTVSSYEFFQQMKTQRTDKFFTKYGLDYVFGDRVAITLSEPYQYMFQGSIKYVDEIAGKSLYQYAPQELNFSER